MARKRRRPKSKNRVDLARGGIVQFLEGLAFRGVDLHLARPKDVMREVEL